MATVSTVTSVAMVAMFAVRAFAPARGAAMVGVRSAVIAVNSFGAVLPQTTRCLRLLRVLSIAGLHRRLLS
jgi:hypothetical protein